MASGETTWEKGQPLAPVAHLAAPARWLRWSIPLLLALVLLGLALPRLHSPNEFVFDELYYAFTAGKYVAGSENSYRCCRPPRESTAIEWTHPPLAKLLIAGGILTFGDNPSGWRAASVLFGALAILIVFSLAIVLTGSTLTATLAASLLLLDGLFFVESRTGMSNLFLLVFTNAALLAFARVLSLPLASVPLPLLATGALLGLALATKWSTAALLGLVGIVYGWRVLRETRLSASRIAPPLLWGALALILLPLVIYLLSYGHFFLTGHGWPEFVSLHASMFDYHRNLGVVHAYSSSWWEWPMALRPVWYYADRQGDIGAFVFANGNIALYWPMVIAVGWVAIDWWGRRPAALTILLLGFLGQWLPWALSPRGTFVYHFLPAVPMGCIALAIVISGAWSEAGWRRGVAIAYGVLVLAIFVYFYPLYTAMPLTADQVTARMWLPSWR